ncbi:UNVERIFIED_CONTAM: hypothetical protein FKN15_043104 [Acipenser sinensis]
MELAQEEADDNWELFLKGLAAELCPSCGAYGHTVAICPTQYEEEEELPLQKSRGEEPVRPVRRGGASASCVRRGEAESPNPYFFWEGRGGEAQAPQQPLFLLLKGAQRRRPPPALPPLSEEPAAPPALPPLLEEPAAPPALPPLSEEPAAPPALPPLSEEPAAPPALPPLSEEQAVPPALTPLSEEPAAPPALPLLSEEPAAPPALPLLLEEPAAPPEGDKLLFPPPPLPPEGDELLFPLPPSEELEQALPPVAKREEELWPLPPWPEVPALLATPKVAVLFAAPPEVAVLSAGPSEVSGLVPLPATPETPGPAPAVPECPAPADGPKLVPAPLGAANLSGPADGYPGETQEGTIKTLGLWGTPGVKRAPPYISPGVVTGVKRAPPYKSPMEVKECWGVLRPADSRRQGAQGGRTGPARLVFDRGRRVPNISSHPPSQILWNGGEGGLLRGCMCYAHKGGGMWQNEESSGQIVLTQSPTVESVSIGGSVTLNCRSSSSGFTSSLAWYLQKPGGAPKLLFTE